MIFIARRMRVLMTHTVAGILQLVGSDSSWYNFLTFHLYFDRRATSNVLFVIKQFRKEISRNSGQCGKVSKSKSFDSDGNLVLL
jgi:hypothetical protein